MTELSERAKRLLDQAREADRPSEGQRRRTEQALRRRLQIAGQAVGVFGASLSAAAAAGRAATTGAATTGAATTGAATTGAAATSGALASSAVGSGAVSSSAPGLGLAAAKVATALGSSTGVAGTAGVGAAGTGIAGMSVASVGAKLVVSAVIGIAGASVGHEVITRVAPAPNASLPEVAAPAWSSVEPPRPEAINPAELSRSTLFPTVATSDHENTASTTAIVATPTAPHSSSQSAPLTAPSAVPPSAVPPSAVPPSAVPPLTASSAMVIAKAVQRAATPKTSEPQRLGQEVRDLERSQQLLNQGQYERAIELLEESQRKHAPAGALRGLSTERSALLALSYCAAQDPARRARGKELARQFLLAHPNSPLSARVRSECDSD